MPENVNTVDARNRAILALVGMMPGQYADATDFVDAILDAVCERIVAEYVIGVREGVTTISRTPLRRTDDA